MSHACIMYPEVEVKVEPEVEVKVEPEVEEPKMEEEPAIERNMITRSMKKERYHQLMQLNQS